MKYLLIILYILLTTQSFAVENQEKKDWILDRVNIYIENDVYFGTDDGYSTGEMLTFLYFVPEPDNFIYDILGYNTKQSYSYLTFSIANQIFTPTDTSTTAFQADDRPYAGWTYLKTTFHKTTKTQLRSLSLKVGMIGPASGSEQIQNNFHKTFGMDIVNGWEHQLNNELGINLKYTQKWKYHGKDFGDIEGYFIPYTSLELGNVAINATGGFTARLGWNIPKDYGLSSINIGNDPGIPVYGQYKNMRLHPWSFSINFTAAGTAVARDIFLDGNTFTDSHSMSKEKFVGYYGLGFTLRYKNFVLDIMEIENSKQFKGQKKSHGIGSAIISWLY
ncbi:MAG: lipid A deacylase LpxR family protein [Helicobacteraceae bacterium]|nr:lipid A deacylase LpxR family protein [Candidatus Sulfurimonas ponti]MBL6973353.1 lipid A deacylase LpxR family protein [Sulfurimonas sp.]